MMNEEKFNEVFPHESMRSSQKEGIPEVYSEAKDGGWVLLEGATGTGKTILSLSGLLPLIEESEYERILVVTNVQQQQEIFENEIRKINTNTNKEIDSVTLKGKDSLCTFVESGEISERAIYWRCDELRKGTRELNEMSSYENLAKKSYSKEGKYPFSENEIPEYINKEYCPFYANFLENMDNDKKFEEKFNGSLKTEEILEKSSKEGFCPHATAGKIMNQVDVVIANYNHILDKTTVENYTDALIGDDTLLIIDEAHNLVPEARYNLSHTITLNDINRSVKELLTIEMFLKLPNVEDLSKIDNQKLKRIEKRAFIDFGNPKEFQKCLSQINSIIQTSDYELRDIIETKDFFKQLVQNSKKIMGENPEKDTIPTRQPDKIEKDRINQWIELYLEDKQISTSDIIEIKDVIIKMLTTCCMHSSKIDRIPEFSSEKNFNFIDKWVNYDNKNYFRTIERHDEETDKSRLKIFNTVPRKEISEKLDKFGGGVLMSATLEPLDMFSEEIGLDDPHKMSYGLPFPEENRLSLSVKLPKFTYSNRGQAFSSNKPVKDNIVRKEYIDAIKRISKKTEGNTMIIMPSYSEAQWISEILIRENEIKKEILIDESSSFDETEEMKNKFTRGKDKILATSARGTLTEGIDYKGDQLNNVIVVGVPIENTQDSYSKAILKSYKEVFSNSKGFELAFILPAVRKTRQAIGRVIRTHSDKGIRALIDERYCHGGSVRDYLGESEKEEFQEVQPSNLESFINVFWND